jgi:hypothetical protein
MMYDAYGNCLTSSHVYICALTDEFNHNTLLFYLLSAFLVSSTRFHDEVDGAKLWYFLADGTYHGGSCHCAGEGQRRRW